MNLNNKLKILKNRKVVSFEDFGILESNRALNFIQIYVDDFPYFRASSEKPYRILEKFLKELNVSFETVDYTSSFPVIEGDNYKLVGLGNISGVYSLDKDTKKCMDKYFIDESSDDNYIYIGGQWDYIYRDYEKLKPNEKHFLDIIDYFSKGLVFPGVRNSFVKEIFIEEDELPF